MKLLVLGLIGLIILSGCSAPQQSVRYEYFEVIATSEEMCLKIADESFDEVCNEVLKDKEHCLKVWDSSTVQFDSTKNRCIIGFPVGGETK